MQFFLQKLLRKKLPKFSMYKLKHRLVRSITSEKIKYYNYLGLLIIKKNEVSDTKQKLFFNVQRLVAKSCNEISFLINFDKKYPLYMVSIVNPYKFHDSFKDFFYLPMVKIYHNIVFSKYYNLFIKMSYEKLIKKFNLFNLESTKKVFYLFSYKSSI